MQQDNPAYIGPVLAIGLLSMLYGCLIVFFAAWLCSDAQAEKIDFGKINSHLLEIYALIILMIFAPDSMFEWADRLFGGPPSS